MPVSASPGPHSMKVSTPSSTMRRTDAHPLHRRAHLLARAARGSGRRRCTGSAVTLLIDRRIARRDHVTVLEWPGQPIADARHQARVERPRDRQRDHPSRARRAERVVRVEQGVPRTGNDDLPRRVVVRHHEVGRAARGQRSPPDHRPRSRPITAAMPPLHRARPSARPRRATRRSASATERTPAATSAAYSPTEWPGDEGRRRPVDAPPRERARGRPSRW